MKRILVVDDEEGLGLSIRRAMRLHAPDIKVLLAPHGAAAVALLQTQPVSLVITDLLMPVMDGFELLAWLSQNQPTTPAIAMTGVKSARLEARVCTLGAGMLIEKPFEVHALIARIREVLGAAARGLIEGMGLGTFVQMIGMENKTCTLRVAAGGRTGALYFSCGELMTAETEASRGEEAALDLLGWDGATIEIVPSCREQRREIERPLGHLLMDACRLKDERAREAEGPTSSGPREVLGAAQLRGASAATLQGQLRGLREVEGYRGAALMGFTGEVLVVDVVDSSLDFPAVCATGADLFRRVHLGGKAAQVDLCEEMVVRSAEAILLLRCSGPGARAHFHLLALLRPEGNQALAKVKLEALVPDIVNRLA